MAKGLRPSYFTRLPVPAALKRPPRGAGERARVIVMRAKPWIKRAGPWMIAGTLGAAAEYLLDPDRGKARRSQARTRVAGRARRVKRAMTRRGRRMAADAAGMRERLARREQGPLVDDVALKHRVESDVLGRPWVEKGRINIDAVNGVVSLRGQVSDALRQHELVETVRRIPGVRDVTSFLHLPHEIAPNIRQVIDAQKAARPRAGNNRG